MQCVNCYTASIHTADSFEHERGAYCKLVLDSATDGFGKNGKHRLIASDDWHLERYTSIPDWCPLLDKREPTEKEIEEARYKRYREYVAQWLANNENITGTSVLTFAEWKIENAEF